MGSARIRNSHGLWRILVVSVCLSLLTQAGCSSGQKKSSKASEDTQTSQTASTKNQIRELRVQELDSSTLITIDGQKDPDFTVFKLNDPLRVVVDLANTELGSIAGPFAVNNGTVNEINTTQFDDASTSISRVIIGFDQVVDYEVVPEGTRLKINVQRIGAKPANAQEIVAKSEAGAGKPSSPEVAASEAPPLAAGAPAETPADTGAPAESAAPPPVADLGPTNPATQVVDVQVIAADGMETVTFVADGKIGEFKVFRLENPARLVVDFPGLSSGYAKKRISAPAPLKNIRLGSHTDKLRVVMDSRKAKSLPEHSAEAQGDRLILRIGAGASSLVAQAPTGETAPPPLPEAGAPEKLPSATGPIGKVSALDFRQLPKASRISVKVPESVSYQSYPYADGKIIVELVGAKIPKNLQRALDTSEFDSPVLLISAYPQKGADGVVRVEVKLREEVPLNIQREGNVINMDFERTKVFLATTTEPAAPTASAVTEPGAKAGAEPSAMAEEPGLAPPSEEGGELAEGALALEKAPPQSKSSEAPGDGTVITKSGVENSGSSLSGDGQMSDVITGSSATGGQRFTGRRISLDFKDADIKNIFRLIAEVSKLNIVVGDNVNGKVTLRLINVPWDQALAIILQSKKLGIVRYDNILRIAPLTELEQERKEALSAKEAERDLEDLKVLVLPINYTKAGDLKAKLQNLLTKRGRLTVDDRTNTIILEDIQEVLVKARSLVKTLDTATHQVVIDARVVTARRNWQRALGIQWGGSYQMSGATGNPTGLAFPSDVGIGGGSSATGADTIATPRFPGFASPNYAVNLPSAGENGALGISLGSLAGIGQLDVRLAALENESKARVVSSPRVTTLDNVAAKISQGTKVPFSTVSSAGTQTTFVDATLDLSVTPHVTNDKHVSMKLAITNNSVGAVTAAGPQIDIAETTTEILVKDGDTTVIGGIYVLDESKANDGIPFLKEIPVIKIFFTNYNRTNNRSELLFFITPRIVQAYTSLATAN